MFKSLKEAMQTKLEPVVLSVEEFTHKGVKRLSIKAKKARGQMIYTVIQYETGLFSSAVGY